MEDPTGAVRLWVCVAIFFLGGFFSLLPSWIRSAAPSVLGRMAVLRNELVPYSVASNRKE